MTLGMPQFIALGLVFFTNFALADLRGEKCLEAGGIWSSDDLTCACKDGTKIDPSNFERCESKPYSVDDMQNFCAHLKPDPHPLTPKDLHLFAKRVGARSPQELIEKFKGQKKWEPFLNSVNFVKNSESEEENAVTPTHPRRILFHKGLIMASTAHPDTKTHRGANNSIPIFAMHPKKGWLAQRIDFKNGAPVLDENPISCTGCHGTPPRPHWAAYRYWPGAVESSQDFLTVEAEREATPEEIQVQRKEQEEEMARANKIEKETGRRVPFIHRPELIRGVKVFRTFRENLPDDYKVFEDVPRDSGARDFNKFLNLWNFPNIARQLRTAHGYESLRYAMVGALLECEDIPSFLGNADSKARLEHEKNLGKSFAKIMKHVSDTNAERKKTKAALGKEYGQTEMGDFDGHDTDDIQRVTGLKYLFDKRGVHIEDFSLDYTPGEYGYEFNRSGNSMDGLHELLCQFYPSIIRSAPKALAPLLNFIPVKSEGVRHIPSLNPELKRKACTALRHKSREAFAGIPIPKVEKKPLIPRGSKGGKTH